MKLTSRRRLSSQVHTAIRVTGCAAAACVVVAAANLAYAGAGLVPHKAISLPAGVSSFDISFVDPATHTYILGDRTNNGVDVIDTKTNTLRMIAGQGLVQGRGCRMRGGQLLLRTKWRAYRRWHDGQQRQHHRW